MPNKHRTRPKDNSTGWVADPSRNAGEHAPEAVNFEKPLALPPAHGQNRLRPPLPTPLLLFLASICVIEIIELFDEIPPSITPDQQPVPFVR